MDPQVVTLVVAGASALTSILALLAGRKERKANAQLSSSSATAQISGGYARLIESQNSLISALESRVSALEQEKDDIREDFEGMLEEKEKQIRGLEQRLELAISERNEFAVRLASMENKIDGLTNGGSGK